MSIEPTKRAAALALGLFLGLPAGARADVCPPVDTSVDCYDGHHNIVAHGELRTYLLVTNPGPNDSRASYVCSAGKEEVKLQGWVFIPTGTPPAGGFPVIIYNHGSEEDPGPKCSIARYFTGERRYIVFAPIRRGHSGSTGTYFERWADDKADQSCPGFCGADRNCCVRYWTVNYLKDQANDVKHAYNYIQNNYPKANDDKMSLMGHSFGGIVTLFTNAMDLGQRAAVDIGGGSQSWVKLDGEPFEYLQDEMGNAVDDAQRPVFFLQPKNDVDTDPTIELSHRAGRNGMRYQAAIFPKVPQSLLDPCPREDPNDPTRTLSCEDVAHAQFVLDDDHVQSWGKTAVDFLDRFGGK
jgi:PGAP1-like protein